MGDDDFNFQFSGFLTNIAKKDSHLMELNVSQLSVFRNHSKVGLTHRISYLLNLCQLGSILQHTKIQARH